MAMKLSAKANDEALNIGFGTWQITPDTIARAVVTLALQAGFRMIDTATIYRNEIGVGEAIKSSGIQREEIYISTKLWNNDQGYESSKRAFSASLNRLGLDYIDLYLIHWPMGMERIKDSWHALEEIQQSGQASAIGVSNFTDMQLEELSKYAKIQPAVNQIELHPFIYKAQQPTIDYCIKNNILVQAYSPLSRASKIRDPHISSIANRINKSNAQVMLRWAIQHNTIPLPRSTDEKHIEQNINVFDFSLSESDMQALDNLYDGTRLG